MVSAHKEIACTVLVLHPRWFIARRLLRPGVKFCVNSTLIIDNKRVGVNQYLSEFTFHFISKREYITAITHIQQANRMIFVNQCAVKRV